MQLNFWCAGWPDCIAVRRRLGEVAGLGEVHFSPDGRALAVQSESVSSAREAALRLRELGWRRTV